MTESLRAQIPNASALEMRATLTSPVQATIPSSISIKDNWVQDGDDAFSTGGAYDLYLEILYEKQRAEDKENELKDLINNIEAKDIDLSNYITYNSTKQLIDSSIAQIVPPMIAEEISNLNIEDYVQFSQIENLIAKVNDLPTSFITSNDVLGILNTELNKLNLVDTDTLDEVKTELAEDIQELNTSVFNINTTLSDGIVTKVEYQKDLGDIQSILEAING